LNKLVQRLLDRIQQPEPVSVPWGWGIALWLVFAYVLAQLMSLLMVTTLRDDDVTSPDGLSIILSALLATFITFWLVIQYSRNALWEEAASRKKNKPTRSFFQVMSFNESRSAPFWVMWFYALIIAIIIDTVSLLLGKPDESLPIGLDRLNDADAFNWIAAGLLYVVFRPVVEALIFQGMFYPALVKSLGDNLRALVLTTLVLTAVYFIQVAGDFNWTLLHWGLIYPLSLGLTAGIIRAHSKSTTAALGAYVMFGIFLMLKTLITFG
jgi:hypothetical protein